MKKRSIAAPVLGAAAVLAAVGELPEIPGCPLHASCAAALESGTLNPFAGSPLEGAFAAVSVTTVAKAAATQAAVTSCPCSGFHTPRTFRRQPTIRR